MDAFPFIRLIKENSAVAFNNLASDLAFCLHINGEQCEAHPSLLPALLCSAMVSVGPQQLYKFHCCSLEIVIIELEGSLCYKSLLAMQFCNGTSSIMLSVIPCAIITGLAALLKNAQEECRCFTGNRQQNSLFYIYIYLIFPFHLQLNQNCSLFLDL